MKRVFFAGILVMCVLLGINSSVSWAADLPVVEAKIATIYNAKHPLGIAAVAFADKVKELSGGKFNISVFFSEQLGNMKEAFEGTELGIIEFDLAPFAEPAKIWEPASITDTPYIFKDKAHLFRAMEGKAFDIIAEGVLKNTGVRVLGNFYAGTRYITTKNTPATTPDEIKAAGLKIRTPETKTAIAAITICGGTPTPMALSDAYIAMQQGAVDGQENPLQTILLSKFFEVQKYILLTGHIIQPQGVFVNEKFYQSLPDEYKKMLDEAGPYASKIGTDEVVRQETLALTELQANGMETVEVKIDAFLEASAKYHEENINVWGQELYDAIMEVR